jgi:hypothetical protein
MPTSIFIDPSGIAPTGTVNPDHGGTGITSYAVGDLLYASGATTLSKLADVATGQVLVSGGVGVAPAYSATPSVTTITASTAFIGPGTTGAAGDVRLKNAGAITFRKADNSADAAGLTVTSGNVWTGGGAGIASNNLGNDGATLSFSSAGTLTGLTFSGAATSPPVIIGTTGLLSTQGADIGATNLKASAAAGLYIVTGWIAVTRAASSSSTLPSIVIAFNNGTAQSITLTATDTGNVLTTFKQASCVIKSNSAQAITYATTGFASSGGTSMQYQLHVALTAVT